MLTVDQIVRMSKVAQENPIVSRNKRFPFHWDLNLATKDEGILVIFSTSELPSREDDYCDELQPCNLRSHRGRAVVSQLAKLKINGHCAMGWNVDVFFNLPQCFVPNGDPMMPSRY